MRPQPVRRSISLLILMRIRPPPFRFLSWFSVTSGVARPTGCLGRIRDLNKLGSDFSLKHQSCNKLKNIQTIISILFLFYGSGFIGSDPNWFLLPVFRGCGTGHLQPDPRPWLVVTSLCRREGDILISTPLSAFSLFFSKKIQFHRHNFCQPLLARAKYL